MNKNFFISLFVLALIGGGLYLIAQKTPLPEAQYSTVPAVTATPVSVAQETEYAKISGEYPRFSAVSETFNGDIRNFIETTISEHNTMVKADWDARIATAQNGETFDDAPSKEMYGLGFRWTPDQVNNEFISFVLHFGGYTGGAHGYENVKSWNYDVKNNRTVTLAELFSNDPNYLKTIAEYSYADILRQYRTRLAQDGLTSESEVTDDMIPIEMVKAGTEPKDENYQVFTFNQDFVTIYFGQYQVGPYVAGTFEVKIPRK